MESADGDAPAGPSGGSWVTAGAVLLLFAAVTQLVYGLAALTGFGALEDNVRDIESNQHFGDLYLSLGGWGVLLLLAALAELGAALSLARRREHSRLLGLGAAILGLGVAFFTLALFHLAALVSVTILFLAMYVLSYRVGDPPTTSPM